MSAERERLVREYDVLRGEMTARKLQGLPALPRDADRLSELAAALDPPEQAERLERFHKPTGRPIEITWEMVREARALLRSAGKKGTQQEVADRLGCTVETVKRRAHEHGGWSQA